jgi:hypothetical protein
MVSINPKYIGEDYGKIEEIFKNDQFKLTLYYIDIFNDASSRETPLYRKVDALYTYLDLNYFKRKNVNFQKFTYSEDRNYFYIYYHNSSHMKLFSNDEVSVSIPERNKSMVDDKGNLAKFFIRAVNNDKTILKSYQKIPEFLASISGLLVNMLVFMAILLTFYNQFQAKQYVMTKIMKYKDILKEKNSDSLKYLADKFNEKEIQDRLDVISKSAFDEERDSHSINGNNDTLRERMLRRNSINNPYRIGIKDICLLICCCRSIKKKKIIYTNAEKKFNYNIDLVTFMMKMQEIDIIKYLLLDENTLTLMNFISKPSVSLTNNKIRDKIYKKFFSTDFEKFALNHNNIDELKNSYLKLIKKNEHTLVEKKLIELFELQINEIIN